jgi:hypothetical protein
MLYTKEKMLQIHSVQKLINLGGASAKRKRLIVSCGRVHVRPKRSVPRKCFRIMNIRTQYWTFKGYLQLCLFSMESLYVVVLVFTHVAQPAPLHALLELLHDSVLVKHVIELKNTRLVQSLSGDRHVRRSQKNVMARTLSSNPTNRPLCGPGVELSDLTKCFLLNGSAAQPAIVSS